MFHDGPFKTLAVVEYATAGWVDWYTNRRLHSTIGMAPPAKFKEAHYAALNTPISSPLGSGRRTGAHRGRYKLSRCSVEP